MSAAGHPTQWIYRLIRLSGWLLLLLVIVACEQSSSPQTTANAVITPTMLPTSTILPTATPPYTPVFEPADCRFEVTVEVDIQCGYLIVPEDRTRPEQMIRLHVAIVSSHSNNPEPDPIVYLSGGPGGHTLIYADYMPDCLTTFWANAT